MDYVITKPVPRLLLGTGEPKAPIELARQLFHIIHSKQEGAEPESPSEASLLESIDKDFGVQLNPTYFPLPAAPAALPKDARCKSLKTDVLTNCGEKALAHLDGGHAAFQCNDMCASAFAGYYVLCIDGEVEEGLAEETPTATVVSRNQPLWNQFSDFFLTCRHCPMKRRETILGTCGIGTNDTQYPRECSEGCSGKFIPFFRQCLQHEIKYLPSLLQSSSYNFFLRCKHVAQNKELVGECEVRRQEVFNQCEIDGFGGFVQCSAKCADILLPYVDDCKPKNAPGLPDFIHRCKQAVIDRAKAKTETEKKAEEAKHAEEEARVIHRR